MIPEVGQMTVMGALVIAMLGQTPVLAVRMENLFTPCTSAQLKLSSPESGRHTKISCSIVCKNRKCDGFSYVGGRCSLDDNTLPASRLVTVTEGCFTRKNRLEPE